MKRNKWLMGAAHLAASNSHCKRRQVGAVIAKNRRIISTGWNGMPQGLPNPCENSNISHDEVIHAEANAILWAARNGLKLKGTTLYVTMSPCVECAKMIIQAGIKKVVYTEEYRKGNGLQLLRDCNVKVKHERE